MPDSTRFAPRGLHKAITVNAQEDQATIKSALESDHPPEPEIKFYLARHLARSGAEQDALRTLHALAAEGFVCSTAMRRDPWLKPLARLPEFAAVISDVLQREADARSAFVAADEHRILSIAVPDSSISP